MENNNLKKRLLHYDILRIFACFSVLMLHCAAQFWYVLPITDPKWLIANSYDALFRFGVPLFVMISGALFLTEQKELNIKRLYTHNILRLLSVYVIWSCAYGLLDYRNSSPGQFQLKMLLKRMLHGRYHLWFLPMLIGLYILLPILKIWIQNASRKNIQYFLALFFVVQIGRNTVTALYQGDELLYLASLAEFDMVCGYMGYFVLGYYLTHYELPQKYRRLLYLAALPAALCNVVLSALLSWKRGKPTGDIYDSFSVFTFIITVALFVFVTEKAGGRSFSVRTEKIISGISRDTLGIYVMHIGLIETLLRFGIHSMTVHCIAGIPLLAVFCFLFCGFLAALLRRLPLVGKYIC